MLVTIPACEQHEGILSLTIEISDFCPVCGGPRGKTRPARAYDRSHALIVDCWTNACGHVDKYESVRAEHAEHQAAVLTAMSK